MQRQYSHTSGPSLTSIQSPHCPNCGQPMRLARIAPGPGGPAFDIKPFECAGCHHIDTATVETDPMKSKARLWLASHDLRRPT
jgi:hypothetical protein